jgi:hypothetical protein
MRPTISLIQRIRQVAIAIALQIIITLNAIYLFDNPAIADTTTLKIVNLVAYDIDQEVDQQRKQETQKHYGEEVGEIVDDALKNNEESSKYKIKREDPLNKKVGKFFQQIKDKGLIDVDEDNKS